MNLNPSSFTRLPGRLLLTTSWLLAGCDGQILHDNTGGANAGGGGSNTTSATTDTTSTTTTLSEGGSGGVGGTSSQGGAAGAPSDGGSGGASPESLALCEKTCRAGTCSEDICDQPAGLYLTAATSEGADAVSVSSMPVLTTQLDVLAVDGDCVFVQAKILSGPLDLKPFDAGTLTVSAPTSGLTILPPPNGTDAVFLSMPTGSLFSEGDPVTLAASGGVDYPELSLSVTMPPPISLTAQPITAGQPFEISWSPSPPPDRIQTFGLLNGYLVCTPTLPDKVVVSGAITALFDAEPGNIGILAWRETHAKTSFGADGPHVRAVAQSSSNVLVPYTP